MIRQGHICQVALFPHNFWYKLSSVLLGNMAETFFMNFFFNRLMKKVQFNPDVIVVIKGSLLNSSNYDCLKNKYANSKFVLYIWDDINLDKKELDIIGYFDKICSYNPMDCKEYGFTFRPMFFDQSMNLSHINKSIDLYYIASYRKNRLDFICKLLDNMCRNALKYKVVLKCNPLLILSDIKNLGKLHFFRILPIEYSEMIRDLAKSKCCVELCRPHQKSLSTRPFEALGTRTKVITTNKNIASYNFFIPQNILIVDEKNPVVPENWLDSPYIEVDNKILEQYTLCRFVEELLCV